MEYRKAGEVVTLETRSEAEAKVDKNRRYSQIIRCLKDAEASPYFGQHGLTAKECAVWMAKKGQIPTDERNFTAPRLTEMAKMGWVEPVGKKVCEYTGRTVAVYALREVVNG